jgi:hypothetical protein
MDLDPDKLTSSPFAIGAIGSLVALKSAPGSNWLERFTNVMCGSVTAAFGTPALAEWMQFSPAATNLSAFVIGLISMSLIASILQGVKQIDFAGIASSWLKRGG